MEFLKSTEIDFKNLNEQWDVVAGVFEEDQTLFFKVVSHVLDEEDKNNHNTVIGFVNEKGDEMELDKVKECLGTHIMNKVNKDIYNAFLAKATLQGTTIVSVLPSIIESSDLFDLIKVEMFNQSSVNELFKTMKEKNDEDTTKVVLKLLTLFPFENLDVSERTFLSELAIQNETKSEKLIRLCCAVLRRAKANIPDILYLIEKGEDHVTNAAADELFSECLEPSNLTVIRQLILNKMPPSCPRVKDVIVTVLQANTPSLSSIERVKIALELSRYRHLRGLREYIIGVIQDADIKVNEVITTCFEVLTKKGLNFQEDLVDSLRYVFERIIPVNQQLQPRIITVLYNGEYIKVFKRETANDLVDRLKTKGVVVAFGEIIKKDVALEDVGLKDGDEIQIDKTVVYSNVKVKEALVVDQVISNTVSQLISGNVDGKLKLLEVLPYVKQAFQPQYVPYKFYMYLKENVSLDELSEELLCFDATEKGSEESLEALCDLLGVLGEEMQKLMVMQLCSEPIGEGALPLVHQLIISPSLHKVVPEYFWKCVLRISPLLRNQDKHEFYFHSIFLFHHIPEFVNTIIESQDIVLISLLLQQTHTQEVLEKCKMVVGMIDANDDEIENLKVNGCIDYLYDTYKYFPKSPESIIKLLEETKSERTRWVLLCSMKNKSSEIINKFNEELPMDGMNTFEFNGFKNPSVLCYMNSVLVQLLSIDEFQSVLMKTASTNRIVNLLKSALNYFMKNLDEFDIRLLMNEMQKMFPSTNLNEFNDVSEFLMLLWDALEKQLDSNDYKQLSHYFSIVTEEKFGLDKSIKREVQMSLLVPYGMRSIEQYIAETDNLKHIVECPDYLQIQLQRSLYDSESKSGWNSTDMVSFGYELELPKENDSVKYSLKGVIVHMGTVSVGHYISYIVDPSNNEDWFCFNDDKVSHISWYNFDIQTKCFGQQANSEFVPTAYILIYQKMHKVNRCVNQTISFIAETQQRQLPLPTQMVEKLFAFSVTQEPTKDTLRALSLIKDCYIDVSNKPLVVKLLRYLVSNNEVVRVCVYQLFANYHKLPVLDFNYVTIVSNLLSTNYTYLLPTTTSNITQWLLFLESFCSREDIGSIGKTVLIYATKSLSVLNNDVPNAQQVKTLLYQLIGMSHPTIVEIQQEPQLLRCVLLSKNGSEEIKHMFNDQLFELSLLIKECFDCEDVLLYTDLIQMILDSENVNAIYSLLSIYTESNRSSKHKSLKQEFTNGLFTLVKPTPRGLMLLEKILKNKDKPIVRQCLNCMYGAYDLMRDICTQYVHSIKPQITTFEQAKAEIINIGFAIICEECDSHP
ncbi:hypothetical protein EIN_222970 [Entamoeba invadens IP1]|uniref:USP domain-containing protein n=1 Tax=Entamoeba invadens IP1 TaxID=370355 RepID=A0A0A1U271_ENTIV|nr:hypothetical protein EIN_222970 [Entamoeba invadens IP1]ELP88124.1 hypothetical protein EIN_222970 [Entamoeba invadens IP1]|eukprot:XP_004254895.1 hypothetical protein EIN_222970 [Entamoeba invadens IP1]